MLKRRSTTMLRGRRPAQLGQGRGEEGVDIEAAGRLELEIGAVDLGGESEPERAFGHPAGRAAARSGGEQGGGIEQRRMADEGRLALEAGSAGPRSSPSRGRRLRPPSRVSVSAVGIAAEARPRRASAGVSMNRVTNWSRKPCSPPW